MPCPRSALSTSSTVMVGAMPVTSCIPIRASRGDGAMIMPELNRDDGSWTEDYAHFLSAVARRPGAPPEVVELHAGKKVAIECMVEAMARVRDSLRCELHAEVTIAVENKPGQAVASVGDVIKAADLMDRQGSGLGIMLDVPNLWKAGCRRAARKVGRVPLRRLIGMHVHERHRTPSASGMVDWDAVRGLLSGDGNIIINPEVFHPGDLERTLDFIRRDLLAPKPHKGAAAFNQ